jgi:hypothetical protein
MLLHQMQAARQRERARKDDLRDVAMTITISGKFEAECCCEAYKEKYPECAANRSFRLTDPIDESQHRLTRTS